MDSSNLDWKKVFKKILLGEELCNSSTSNDKEFKCNLSSSELEKKYSISCENYKTMNNPIKSTSFISKNVSSERAVTLPNSNNKSLSLANDMNRPVPEWNKVFKEILGNKSSKDVSSQEKCDSLLQKRDMLSKPEKNCRAQRKKPHRVYRPKISDEEKEAIEFFAHARTFKTPNREYNLNDFDGSGINIFNYHDEMKSMTLVRKTYPEDSQPMKWLYNARYKPVQTRYS